MKCPNCGKMMEAIPVMLSNEARRYKCHTCDIVKVFVFQNGTEENKMKLNAVKKEA